jgi:hypothetical protein
MLQRKSKQTVAQAIDLASVATASEWIAAIPTPSSGVIGGQEDLTKL